MSNLLVELLNDKCPNNLLIGLLDNVKPAKLVELCVIKIFDSIYFYIKVISRIYISIKIFDSIYFYITVKIF
jgi:hypothetical protein